MFEFITVRELYELYINDRNQLDGIEYVELQGLQIEIVGKSDF